MWQDVWERRGFVEKGCGKWGIGRRTWRLEAMGKSHERQMEGCGDGSHLLSFASPAILEKSILKAHICPGHRMPV